ncbi:MAG: TetR family transcriptional regulator C-terminal domain-containing protein, partial [Bdellovibrionales bacterium]
EGTQPAMERFHAYISAMIDMCESSSCKGGCLSGNIAQEMSDSSEEVRAKIRVCFQEWGQGIKQFFVQAQREGGLVSERDPEELVNVFVDGWQGALLRMKVEKKTEPLHRFLNGFLSIIE